jgi:hypothetical protein
MSVVEFNSLPEFTGSVSPDDYVLLRVVSSSRYFKVKVQNLIIISDAALEDHEENFSNPHLVTKSQVGLSNVINAAQLSISSNLSDIQNPAIALNNLGGVSLIQFLSHATSTANPHAVTPAQIGAYTISQVDTMLLLRAPLSHTVDVNNPHQVSATQVGNSTPQWNADRIQGIIVDDSDIADQASLVYDQTLDRIVYAQHNNGSGISSIAQATDVSLGLLTELDFLVFNQAADAFVNASIQDIGLTIQSDFIAHTSSSNPHNITPTTIGLENLDNSLQLTVANNLSDILDIQVARDNLGLGSMAIQAEEAVNITGGAISGVTISSLADPLPIDSGGTGSTTAQAAVIALGAIPSSALGQANGVAGLDLNAMIPSNQIPDINRSEVLSSTSGIVSLPPSGKRSLKLELTEDTILESETIQPSSNILPGDYHLFVEQNNIGGWTLNFSSDFILLNFPVGFSMPTAPGAYIFLTIRKLNNDTNLYTWLDPVSPPTIGIQKFSETIGDGVATSFAISHALDTRDLSITVYENQTPFLQVSPPTFTVEHTSVNSVTLDFSIAPTLNQYRVVIIG